MADVFAPAFAPGVAFDLLNGAYIVGILWNKKTAWKIHAKDGWSKVTVKSPDADKMPHPASEEVDCGICHSGILHVSGASAGVSFSAHALSRCASLGAVCSTQSK